ncbi:DUF1254 domain-containing protein [Corallococcus sp. M34]|uniref:DUF1254 domain-containing protein n=1 Tax=Citreicoccus inhibens TaxID=2849499 RepID=UPI001C2243EF|nr:DUF1254 domain-containing protein [Citreicoccus inhibens]MBU8900774.1 DUF1254 domain-containing protein [Citreicoccus inhibens]
MDSKRKLESGAFPVSAQDVPTVPYEFERGYPTSATARRSRDDAAFHRAVMAYRFWFPTVSAEGIFNGNREKGILDNESIAILSADPRQIAFTANSDTPYGAGTLDLSSGPMVIELPPGPLISLVDDHHQGWVLDMGLPGPDAGRGGRHLVLPPGYDADVPSGYYIGRSPSLKNLIAVRALPVDGDVNEAMDALRRIRVYPLATAASPRLLQFVDMTGQTMDATPLRWEDNFQFWEVLKKIIDEEPIVEKYLPMYGELSALGIEKGKPFRPDAGQRAILEFAAKIGRDQLLVSAFYSARPDRLNWPDRKWEWAALVPNSSQFETPAGVDLEARDRWFAQAIVASPAMFSRVMGAGSLYWLGVRDKTGMFLDGGKSYKLSIPQPVPGRLFWSVTVYDVATRSQIQNEQNRAALRSLFELRDAAGLPEVELYFGPGAPGGNQQRWIKTTPGKGWFAFIRIYGPERAAFDRSWKPGDFEEMK